MNITENSDDSETENVPLKNYKRFEYRFSDYFSETDSKKTNNCGQTLK